MSDPYKKWAQGDEWEPSASWLNMVTEAAQQVQQALGRPTPGDGQLFQPFTPIRMYNNTGAAIPQLGVVTYTTPMVLPSVNENRFVNDPTVIAIKPDAPLDRFAIALSRVETNAVFWAVVGGVVPCKVTGSGTKVQAITNDVDKLQAGSSGVDLIWSESGSSTRFGMVKLFGAGASSCANTWWLSAEGAPSGGTITFAIQVNSVTEDITFPCPCTIAQTITALEGHSEIDTGDVTVTGGTLPNATQKLVFANNPVIVNAINALTKTWAAEPGYYWEPC